MDIMNKYRLWREKAVRDEDIARELESVYGDEAEIYDRFYRDLEFGTGGLRGVIGAGTNRMNIYTVCRATQGMADFISMSGGARSVAVAYDSRIKSEAFARAAAEVFAGNGIKVYIYSELMPTPMLSFAVRELGCGAGVMITASHNPSKYNGYKAYGGDGCQLNLTDSEKVIELTEKVDIFSGVKRMDFDAAQKKGMVEYIDHELIESYLRRVEEQAVDREVCRTSPLKVIYTPLNGAGNKPVRAILNRAGLNNVTVVPEQEMPDGNFPTAPFPNPEIRQSFERAMKLAETVKADLLLATDPDCDRVGIAVRDGEEYKLMSGNEVGALLLDYILSRRSEQGSLPKNPVVIKTIVTTGIASAIARDYGCTVLNLLTGFKFIGEQIGILEKKNQENRFVFGFEESYGYLAGSYVRDKDAVVASMLIAEMVAYYLKQGKTLLEVMNGIYEKYGYYMHTQLNFECEGAAGGERMNEIMKNMRENPPAEIAGFAAAEILDYGAGRQTDMKTGKTEEITLPRSNVLEYRLPKNASVIIRPSGTEPKIKVYVTATGEGRMQAEAITEKLKKSITEIMGF